MTLNPIFAVNGVIPENWANCIANIELVARRNGSLFFDKSAMRFFKSRILGDVHITEKASYFITSECFGNGFPRCYTIRALNRETAMIETVGEFQQFKTSRSARIAMLKL